eukprot:XP_001702779.1 predicted protein [Chlamydomonas reinhardtii]
MGIVQGPCRAACVPRAREGPWADDMEAVAAVTCGRGANTSSDTTCSVTLQNVTFEYNTGVATSGLYVLCDGAARCDVRLHNTSLRHNRLLWQAALEPGDLQGGAVSPYDDTGLQLFRRVMPWLTYTYPLMYIWGGMKSFKAWGSPLYDLFVDPNDPNVGPLPDVTGRTLGAVVVHSRHPPAVGVAPGGAGMVSLVVEGGEFEDNDGAAVMTTAAGRRVPPGAGPDAECLTGERPLYVTQAFHTEVANCSFTGNRNGALSIDTSGGLLVRDSNFTNNVQTYYATGLYVDESSGVVAIQIGRGAVELTGSQFVNNSSPQGGGAAYFSDIYYLRMSNCTFDSNSAPWGDGGAVRVMTTEATADDVQNDSESNSGLAVDSIIDCIFVNNTAGRRGGAIAGVKASLDNTWTIATSAFVNNRAMLFPNVTDILVRSDQAGGGALYAEQLNSLDLTNCTFDGNRVARHAGGAVRVVDMSGVLTTKGVLFQNNAAIVGGALAASRVAQVRITVTSPDELVPSAFINNTAVDPWTWPDTSPLPHVRNNTLYPSLNDLGVGYGGAVHVAYGKFIIDKTALFYNNSAVAARLPVIVFYNNTANGGGAIYIDGADQVHLQGIRLLANRALAPPLAPGHKGLYGREALANGSVAGQPCYRGDGGAVCVTGRAGSSVLPFHNTPTRADN